MGRLLLTAGDGGAPIRLMRKISTEERRSGVWSILGRPTVYSNFQDWTGGQRSRAFIVRHHIRAAPAARILDVGCGPGDVLDFLGPVDYLGIDHSADYIASAEQRFGARGRFAVMDARALAGQGGQRFDIVLALGLLHHLDDEAARDLLATLATLLAPNGRIVTVDGVFEPGQNPLAWLALKLDRGRHVRPRAGYLALFEPCFGDVRPAVYHTLLRIPYSHLVIEAGAPRT